MRKRNILATLFLMLAGLQTIQAQKIILHMPDNQKVEYDISQLDSITFVDKVDVPTVLICPDDNHPHAIDLGLPSGTKWACCNVGANTPEGYGGYYAWGETSEKSVYGWDTYAHGCYDSDGYYHWTNIGSDIAGTNYDVAHVRMGNSWRMPSLDQHLELINNSSYKWTQLNGVNGILVTGPNGGQIFLPAAGYHWDDLIYYAETYGRYWSSSLLLVDGFACSVSFDSHGWNWADGNRDDGFNVRAVCGEGTPPVQLVTAIILSDETISLQVNETKALTATIEPSDATNSAVTWESSNVAVATVNNEGLVTAVAVGTCTITCSATDGSGVKAECTVTVTNSVTPNVHEYVDLGLPSRTLWATCNVGASSPEEYGDYFAWGETEPKDNYGWDNYKYCNGSETTMTKYCLNRIYGTVDNKKELEAVDDAATANWGSDWQMPSLAQFQELINKSYTTTEWTTLNGISGKKITSKKNGNSIFLPAAGYRAGSRLWDARSVGFYWSRSLNKSISHDAYQLGFDSDVIMTSTDEDCTRECGQSVRPVRKK